MSESKKYGVVSDGSVDPLERISELERIWPIMKGYIQKYDSLTSDLQAIKAHISEVNAKHDNLKEDISAVDAMRKDYSRVVQTKFDLFDSDINNLKMGLTLASKNNSDLKKEIQDKAAEANSNLSSTKIIIDSNIDNLAGKEDLQRHKSQIVESIESVVNELRGLQAKHNDQNSGLISAKNALQVNKNAIDDLGSKFSEISNQVPGLLSAFESFKSYISSNVCQETQKASQEVDAKIKGIKDSIATSPVALNALKDELSKKLECVALDGSNAVIRSTNSSNQIALLEKKIENILLRLKAIELPK